jgi:hypothetical protein
VRVSSIVKKISVIYNNVNTANDFPSAALPSGAAPRGRQK